MTPIFFNNILVKQRGRYGKIIARLGDIHVRDVIESSGAKSVDNGDGTH